MLYQFGSIAAAVYAVCAFNVVANGRLESELSVLSQMSAEGSGNGEGRLGGPRGG